MKLTHTFCGRNAEFRSFKAGGLYIYHYAMYQCQIHNTNLGFVVPCIFSHSNKTPNWMQQSIVKFLIVLSYRHCSTCLGHYYAHHQEPVELPLQPLVSVWMWRWNCSQPTTAENTSTFTFVRKPEVATAVRRAPDDGHNNARNMLSSVCTTKKYKNLRLIVTSSWVFYLRDYNTKTRITQELSL